jgi:hypothetical protein
MADLKEAYRRFDPSRPLAGDLLKSYYVQRPGDPMGILAEELQITASPLHILVAGQRGIGKTTELIRLAESLRETALVCRPHPLNAGSVDSDLTYDLSKSAKSAGLSITKSGQQSFGSLVSEIQQSGRVPIVLIDGFERLESTDAARQVERLRHYDCSMIVVVPLGMILSPEFSPRIPEWDRVISLPAVALGTREGGRDPACFDLLQSVIEQRTDEPVFDFEAMKTVIEASAGIHRELLTLSQQACIRASIAGRDRVTVREAKAAVEERSYEYSFHLTPEDLAELRHVEVSKRVTRDPRILDLINRNLIVGYHRDWTWFDVHPVVRPLIDSYATGGQPC